MSLRPAHLNDGQWAIVVDRLEKYNRRTAGRAGHRPREFGAGSWCDLEAIARWQSDNGVPADGMVGPVTMGALAEEPVVVPGKQLPPAPTGIRRIGAWMERGALAEKTAKKWLDKVSGIGLTDVCLVLNDNSNAHTKKGNKDWHLFQSVGRVIEVIDSYAGVADVHLMTWVVPTPEHVEAMGEALTVICDNAKVLSVHLDCEEAMTKFKGGLSPEKLAVALSEALGPVKACGVEVAVTGISYHSQKKLGPVIEAVADYVVPQGYSTNFGHKKPSQWKSPAPGRGQKLAWSRWVDVDGDEDGDTTGYDLPVVMGLACYGQGGIPGFTASAALEKSYRTAAQLGCTFVFYWSFKAVLASKTARDFLTTKCEALR